MMQHPRRWLLSGLIACTAACGSPQRLTGPSALSGQSAQSPQLPWPDPGLLPLTLFPTLPSAADPRTQTHRQTFLKQYGISPFIAAETDPRSTFAADVDTAAYALARSYLHRGSLPPVAVVRTEEFVNAMPYAYPQPLTDPFAIHTEMAQREGEGSEKHYLRIGIQGREIAATQRKAAHLTFVIDVSGSMNTEARLGVVQKSLRLLVEQLQPQDQVGIVIYGSEARTVLAPTSGQFKGQIMSVIDALRPEGATHVEAGLWRGYQMATEQFDPQAINRVILCSDGVANVGNTGPEAILQRIRQQAASGITLTTVGFGMGDYNDALMEQLANQGDGLYAYVDSVAEARRIFVENLTSTLQLLAKDMKIQVRFDPAKVAQYRLLGYENRALAENDFHNDRVDAGEVGANHRVTALYELRLQKPLRSGPVAEVTLRYQEPDRPGVVMEQSHPVANPSPLSLAQASPDLRLAVAVAEYAEILRQSPFTPPTHLDQVAAEVEELHRLRPQQALAELSELIQRTQRLRLSSAQSKPEPSTPALADPLWRDYLRQQLGREVLE